VLKVVEKEEFFLCMSPMFMFMFMFGFGFKCVFIFKFIFIPLPTMLNLLSKNEVLVLALGASNLGADVTAKFGILDLLLSVTLLCFGEL
jgi:hypothetical protein